MGSKKVRAKGTLKPALPPPEDLGLPAELDYLPRVRVKPERVERYHKAFRVWASQRSSDLTISDWIRAACDAYADAELLK